MHVLVTADTVGGVWTYARELVTGLVRKGVRVTLVSFGNIPAHAHTEWMEGLREFEFHATAFRLEWMQEAREDIDASSEYLLKIIEEARPDVLHLNQFCYGALPVSIPKVVVAHSDVVSWWVSVKEREPDDDIWMRWYRDTVSRGLQGAAAVVAPTRWMLSQIEGHYGKPARSSVIYNGRNPVLFNPHVSKEQYVLSVGRLWDGGKQVALLTQFDSPVPIYIAGAEDHADETLRGGRAIASAKPTLHVKGPQTEGQLRNLYSRAAIYAATSRYEPFGLAPLEAALSRCAIVCNDIPSFHEVWGQAAYYFRENDSESLAQAINRLHSDRELRLTYANLAYNRARQRYTSDRMVEDYMDLYQALMAAGVAAA